MKTILSTLVAALLLYGCSTLQPAQNVEHIVYKFIGVPVELTAKVDSVSPPEPVMYSTLTTDQQESLLMLLIQNQQQSINICNSKLYGIYEWSTKQRKIYEPTNP
jgi:hypothetical protein